MTEDGDSAEVAPTGINHVRATVILGLCSLVVGVAIAEVGLRAYAKWSDNPLAVSLRQDPSNALVEPHGSSGFRPVRGATFEYENGTSAFINEHGFRGPTLSSADPQVPLTIVLLGGSTTFGWGVPEDQTISAHMTRSLRNRYPERAIDVVNLAFDGYDSHQLVERLQPDGLALHPVIVIANTGINDVRNSYVPNIVDEDPRTMIWGVEMRRLKEASSGRTSFSTTIKHFFMLARLPGRIRRQMRRSGGEQTVYPTFDSAIDYFQRNMERLVEVSREGGVELVVLSTPPSALLVDSMNTRGFPARSYWTEDARSTQRYRDSLSARLDGIAAADENQDLVVRVVPQLLDLDLFLDDAHLTTDGNEWVAEALVESIAPLLDRLR